MGTELTPNVLAMILYGPSSGTYDTIVLHRPALALKYIANGLVWAWHWPQKVLPMAFYCSFYYMLQTSMLLLSHNHAT